MKLSATGHSNRYGISNKDMAGAPRYPGYINLFVNDSSQKKKRKNYS